MIVLRVPVEIKSTPYHDRHHFRWLIIRHSSFAIKCQKSHQDGMEEWPRYLQDPPQARLAGKTCEKLTMASQSTVETRRLSLAVRSGCDSLTPREGPRWLASRVSTIFKLPTLSYQPFVSSVMISDRRLTLNVLTTKSASSVTSGNARRHVFHWLQMERPA